MAKVFNLDDLKVSRSFVLGGKTYSLRSLDVGEYIAADDVEAKFSAEPDPRKRAKMMIEELAKLTDAPAEELFKMDMTQLIALVAFASGSDMRKAAAKQDVDDAVKEQGAAEGN